LDALSSDGTENKKPKSRKGRDRERGEKGVDVNENPNLGAGGGCVKQGNSDFRYTSKRGGTKTYCRVSVLTNTE